MILKLSVNENAEDKIGLFLIILKTGLSDLTKLELGGDSEKSSWCVMCFADFILYIQSIERERDWKLMPKYVAVKMGGVTAIFISRPTHAHGFNCS